MSELTSRAGVAATQMAVIKNGWFFREQPISDQGVAAIAEDVKVRLLELKQRWLETASLADAKNPSAWRVVAQRVSPAWFDLAA